MRFTTRCAGAHRDTEKAEEEIVGFRIRLPAERELRQCYFFLESTEQQAFSLVFSKPEAMWRMHTAGSAAARIRHISVFFFRLRASVNSVVENLRVPASPSLNKEASRFEPETRHRTPEA